VNVPPWLTALGIPTACITRQSSASEHGRSFSIHCQKGDHVWRVQIDGCWLPDVDQKKADYLFWAESASGNRMVLVVELKGQNFGKALAQIESTLQYLCKNGGKCGIHTGAHQDSPGHGSVAEGGVRAYAVLSKGRGVPKRLRDRERLRQRYGVIVHSKSQRLAVNGVDTLP